MLKKKLRRGWTTGACATAASKAAYIGLLTGICPDQITIKLPNGQTPNFYYSISRYQSSISQCWYH